ncbi:MAG: NAD(+)/NADH kinase [Pontiellaceae bacterium]|jgi:NAD+ kinase|nr:NAD(+)/NADH kinase [Pontiellaceae bacterium]
MKKAGVIANPKRPHAADIFERLAHHANKSGIELFADRQTSEYLPGAAVLNSDQFTETVDVLLALGGDGTVLFCTKLLNGTDIPLLGINLGSLGFLTGLGEDHLETALDALAAGTCERDIRTMADCTVLRNGTPAETYRILNDAVIGFGRSSHIVTLELAIDGEMIASFACDGMIVTTPTGSTGHFLASGGPILHPSADVFGISVICPHTLSNRPIILPDHNTIEIAIRRAYKQLLLAADGQDVTELNEGDIIRITRSEKPVTFLHLPGYSYFSVLSRKLHWRGSSC